MISPEILRRFPFFGGLSPEMLKAIAMLGDETSYEQGDWLFRQGEPAGTFFLVLNGVVELKINLDGRGDRCTGLDTHGVGEVIGWSALVPPHVYTLAARVKSDAKLACIDGRRLRDLLDANPEAGYQLISNLTQVVGERLINLRTQFVSITSP